MTIFWFRRDLRLHDNAGLYKALKEGNRVIPIFIFDPSILQKLPTADARVAFIHQTISELKAELQNLGSDLLVFHDSIDRVFKNLVEEYEITSVYTNRDYEPYAQDRDRRVHDFLKREGIQFKGAKDQVIFEKSEIVKNDGKPYTVYTPYMKKWKSKVNDFYLKEYPTNEYFDNFHRFSSSEMPSLAEMGFQPINIDFPSKELDSNIVSNYASTRDIPSVLGTSRLSIHLRFGTVSIRTLCQFAVEKSEKWYNELIWRDFYQNILFHFPETPSKAFRPAYDLIEWRKDEKDFEAWCNGMTGYPIVDAGMRELNSTGFMHNRVRMIVASFLTKHLLLDWRLGERYFAEKLLDFDLASNVGGWQWASGSGVDAAPYFRIFNPYTQREKFDPEWKYCKKWIPELNTPSYPSEIVEHKFARERALTIYKEGLAKSR